MEQKEENIDWEKESNKKRRDEVFRLCETIGFYNVRVNETARVLKSPITNVSRWKQQYLDKLIEVGRYHSWVVDENLPEELEATSFDENGQIMSLRHKIYDVKGVQFHPESVLTPDGKQMLKNWLNS